jgi:phage shock protein E
MKIMNVLDALKNGTATIVDVRSREEFQGGHVAGSINIPLQEVPAKVEEFKSMPKPVVVCCLSGGRSGQAAAFLQQHGVEDVFNGGGWMDVNSMI